MNRNNFKTRSRISFIIILIILISIVFLSVGYSALVAKFNISNIVTKIRPQKVVRVTNVTTTSNAVSNLDYNVASVISDVNIPAGESITYNVTVTNLGNVPIAVSDVSFSDGSNTISNLSTTIDTENYIKICNGEKCINGVSKDITLTVTNNGNSDIKGSLIADLTFSEYYTITYEGSTKSLCHNI